MPGNYCFIRSHFQHQSCSSQHAESSILNINEYWPFMVFMNGFSKHGGVFESGLKKKAAALFF
jgi:hypothetical protein